MSESEFVVAGVRHGQVFHGEQQVVILLFRQWRAGADVYEEFLVHRWGGEARPSYWVPRTDLTFR